MIGQPSLPLRRRKKLAAMRRAQMAAIGLFSGRGFARVSMEEVAAAAEISPATLYRYFGTKENLVIWDEDDDPFLERLERRLAHAPPFEAFVAAITDSMGPSLQEGMEARSGRLRLIFREPALRSARREESRLFAHEVGKCFARSRAAGSATLADFAQGVAAAAVLDLALEDWALNRGTVHIASILEEAFMHLRSAAVGQTEAALRECEPRRVDPRGID